MNRVMSLLFAVGLAVTTVAGTAEAQARGPLSAGKSDTRGRKLEAAHAHASAPKARNDKSSRDKGRSLSGASRGRSAPVKGR